jgi:DNA modification methylase
VKSGSRGPRAPFKKPPLRIQTTTLWDYPSQHYGEGMQGDQKYVGATPSYVIWNCIQRFTKEGELVIDPMCGSGTTLDVARDTRRRGRGFDLVPSRADVERADARKLPVGDGEAALVFIDPPYGDHIHYSDDPACIGKLSPFDERYYREMGKVLKESVRVLRTGGVLAVFVCDFFAKKRGFAPVGFALFDAIAQAMVPIDVVAVTRHNRTLEMGNYHKAAEEQNFFLRGFNYLFLASKR